MSITVEAVYEDGVLKPAQPLLLNEHERVRVTIESDISWADRTAGMLKWTGDPEVLRQLAEDVIDTCDDPVFLRAFWAGLQKVSVLDPTCGSGAFLFAALNVLEPLYDACLDRRDYRKG